MNPDQDGSPNKYFEGFAANKIYSTSLLLGSAVHGLALQPESFQYLPFIQRPTAKVGFIADILVDIMIKESRSVTDEDIIAAATEVDYYHGNLNEKQLSDLKDKIRDYAKQRLEFNNDYKGDKVPIFLDPKMGESLGLCLNALNQNNKIQSLLHPEGIIEAPVSENERTILLDVEAKVGDKEPIILRLKSKLDNFTIDTETNVITVNDIKTTGKMVNLFDDAVSTYRYNREMAMYSYLLSLCASKFYGMENPTIKSNFLVVSTIPQYYTKVVPMTRSLFLKGFEEFKKLTKMVAYYTVHPEERY